MKFLSILIFILPLSIFAEEVVYQEGDSFKSKKSREVVLYQYKTDASRVNTALTFAFNLGDFMEYAAVDSRDIYKVRRGDTFLLTKHAPRGKPPPIPLAIGTISGTIPVFSNAKKLPVL